MWKTWIATDHSRARIVQFHYETVAYGEKTVTRILIYRRK